MRASDLLGRTVHDDSGHELVVIGIRAVQDGPVRGRMATLRVDAVIGSPAGIGVYLGYLDGHQRGPWLLGAVVRRLHRGTRVIAWARVREELVRSGD